VPSRIAGHRFLSLLAIADETENALITNRATRENGKPLVARAIPNIGETGMPPVSRNTNGDARRDRDQRFISRERPGIPKSVPRIGIRPRNFSGNTARSPNRANIINLAGRQVRPRSSTLCSPTARCKQRNEHPNAADADLTRALYDSASSNVLF